jgi:hypothetical protein
MPAQSSHSASANRQAVPGPAFEGIPECPLKHKTAPVTVFVYRGNSLDLERALLCGEGEIFQVPYPVLHHEIFMHVAASTCALQ